jgi:hypothetical protein
MSFARLSHDSDVYVYDTDNGFECCFCRLDPDGDIKFTKTAKQMVAHLEEHRKAGHRVPNYCMDELKSLIDDKGDQT